MAPPAGRQRSLGRGSRRRILDAAQTLFSRQGFNATSINELRAQARVSKRTVYQQFVSKDEIVLAYLAQSESQSPAAAVLAREDLSPRSRLLELFITLAEAPGPATPDPFIAAAVEFPDPDHAIHRAAAAHAQKFRAGLSELARAAGARDPEQTGHRLAMLYDGAASRALVEDRADAAGHAHAMAAAILRSAID